jgi:hypothetical protein
MSVELELIGTLTITMGTKVFFPSSPAGTRLVIDFADVTLEGERVRAKKAPVPAGDWLTIGPDNVATLDIRFVLETHDGANVLVTGMGRTDSAKFSSGGPLYFAPLFETNDPRYAWLNKVQAIAKGRAEGDVVTFEMYEAR